jgi:hypothetical protein
LAKYPPGQIDQHILSSRYLRVLVGEQVMQLSAVPPKQVRQLESQGEHSQLALLL